MNDIAQTLFGKNNRTVLLRCLALHLDNPQLFVEVSEQTRIKKKQLKLELSQLKRARVIVELKTKTEQGYVVTQPFRDVLKLLFSASSRAADEQLVKRIKKAGVLKFLVCGGKTIGDQLGALDLLVVGTLQPKILERALKPLEEQLGTELRCALFTEEDFNHRLDVRDRLISDLLQGAHKVLHDKLKRK